MAAAPRHRHVSPPATTSLLCAHDRRPHQQRLLPRPRGDRLGRAPGRGRDPPGAHRPAGVAQAHRLRELRLAGRPADHGHLVQRQVRRGHHRAPLLRRLPERRHRRGARRRARPRAVRGAVRLCPAALRHRRQPGGLLGDPGPPDRGARPGRARRQERQRPLRGRLGDPARASWATSVCWACPWTPAATSPTASGPTSAARCSTSSSTAPTPRPGCSTTTSWPPRPASSAR